MGTCNLPHVAEETWRAALDAALANNKTRGKGPTSLRQLSIALGNNPASGQSDESWRRSFSKIRSDERASEAQARLIAEALGVPRETLPQAAERLTLSLLNDRLEEVEEQAATDVVQLRKDLAGAIRRIRALEKLVAAGVQQSSAGGET